MNASEHSRIYQVPGCFGYLLHCPLKRETGTLVAKRAKHPMILNYDFHRRDTVVSCFIFSRASYFLGQSLTDNGGEKLHVGRVSLKMSHQVTRNKMQKVML